MLSAFVFERFEQNLFGLRVILLLKKHPGEAIKVGAVVFAVVFGVGIELAALAVFFEGLADQLLGFVEVHVIVGPDVAEVVVVAVIVGLGFEQFLQHFGGLV